MAADKRRIGLRDVRALSSGEIIYDSAVRGFAARRQKGDAVTYVLRYRTIANRQRWHTIGRHGAPWTPDTARDRAIWLLGEVVKGRDPFDEKKAQREAMTMGVLCDRYWAEVTAGRLLGRNGRPKKSSTLLSDSGRMERHIRPLLGRVPVAALTRQDVQRFMHDVAEGKTATRAKTGHKRGLSNVRGGQGAATRTMGLLGAIMTYAIELGLRHDNPAHGIHKFAENKRERRLDASEYLQLSKALDIALAKGIWPPAIHAVHFLTQTGWRSGEVLSLKWGDLSLPDRTATLADTKTGKSRRPIPLSVCQLLGSLLRIAGVDLVFPAARSTGTMSGFRSIWDRVLAAGSLPGDITPHVLRHSFASVAADLGFSDITIGALIGHKGHSITSRYVHSADTVLLGAADDVAFRISEMMALANRPATDSVAGEGGS